MVLREGREKKTISFSLLFKLERKSWLAGKKQMSKKITKGGNKKKVAETGGWGRQPSQQGHFRLLRPKLPKAGGGSFVKLSASHTEGTKQKHHQRRMFLN